MTATGLLHEQLFERTNEPAYLMDPERGRILAANDAGRAMLGYARAELLETPIAQPPRRAPAAEPPHSRGTAALSSLCGPIHPKEAQVNLTSGKTTQKKVAVYVDGVEQA